MNRLKRIDRWLRTNYNIALAIGMVLGLLIGDLLF
jgi:hypothetical protein